MILLEVIFIVGCLMVMVSFEVMYILIIKIDLMGFVYIYICIRVCKYICIIIIVFKRGY